MDRQELSSRVTTSWAALPRSAPGTSRRDPCMRFRALRRLQKRAIMKKSKLSRGKSAIIDDDDFERVSQFKWYINENAEKTKLYAMRSRLKSEEDTVTGTKVYMHRFILQIVEKSAVIQHKNGNTLDNRKENLVIKKRAVNKKAK